MKTSKLLITSLLAAAAMSTIPAWAEEVTIADGQTLDATAENVNAGVVTIGAGSTYQWNRNARGTWVITSLNGTTADTDTSGSLVYLNRQNKGTHTAALQLSGDNDFAGTIKVTNTSDNIDAIASRSGYANAFIVLNSVGAAKNATVCVGDEDSNGATSATHAQERLVVGVDGAKVAGLTGVVPKATVISRGGMTQTSGYYDNDSGTYDSSDTTVRTLELTGAGSYTFAGVVEQNVSLNKTGTGTQIFSGEVNSGVVSLSAGTLVFSGTANIAGTATVSGGTLDLSGGTITLANAIQNSGTITVSNGTIFNLTDALKNEDGSYTLVSNSGSGSITNWTTDTLSATNFTLDGKLLSGRTQITLDAGGVTFSGGAYDLFWKGGDGTWDMATAANFGKDSVSGADTKFVAGDNVTFSSSATVAVSDVSEGIRADVVSITGTVDAPTTLTLTNQANLTANSIHIGDNATLELGDFTSGGTVNHKLTGTGTVSLAKRSQGHGLSINIGTEFAGTINFAGNLEISNAVLGASSARLNLSSVHMWTGANITKTLDQAITFSGSNRIGGWGFNATLNFSGGLTFAEGASLTVDNLDATKTIVNISGSVADAKITQTNGGTLNISLSGDSTIKSLTQTSGTVAVSGTSATFASATISGKLNITNGVTVFDVLNVAATATDEIDVTGGTSLTIKSGSILKGLHVETGTEVNIGDGTKASTLTLARLEMGDNQTSGGDTLNVRQNATLVITGSDDTTSGDGDPNTGEGSRYKLTGIMLGEWGVTTTANIEGKMLAENASVFSGDNNMTLNVESGGVLAVKGIGQSKTEKSSTIKLDLADNGTLILGSEGITRFGSGTWSASLGAGTIGTSNADGTTISKDMTLTSAAGTTFDTQLWNFAADGADITRSADTASSITINGVISGDGALKKAGAGMLTLSNANTYKGGTVIEAGTVVAAHANALGTTKGVEVKSGATLNLGTSAVTVAGLSGAGSVGLASGTDSATLTVNGGGVFTGTLSEGENSLALVFDADGQTLELNPTLANDLSSVDIRAGTVKTGNALGLGHSANVTVQSLGTLEFTTSNLTTKNYGLMLIEGGITFKNGASFVVDVTGAATDVALSIITSSVIKFYNGSEDVSLTSDNLDQFVDNFVKLTGWDGLADWAYDGSKLSLTMAIPEPSAFGLLAGLGALALAGTRRRRKKA